MGSIASILGFLIANGPALIQAGGQVSAIVSAFIEHFWHKPADGTVTKEEFNAFLTTCIGDRAKIVALIAQAEAEIAAQ